LLLFRFDNPAAEADFPARHLTYNYLFSLNAWLLIFPLNLCCDWTMGTIPLVETFFDIRNLATFIFYAVFLTLSSLAFLKENTEIANVLIISLSLIIFPFLPASNLFFPVGFVIAERILYIPSMGFSMLIGFGWYILLQHISKNETLSKRKRHLFTVFHLGALFVLILSHSLRTWTRNFDWESEYTLFSSGLKVTQNNAKLFNNVGHSLEHQGKYREALEYFLKASMVQPDDIGAHINVGRTYNNLNNYDLAEKYFLKAKSLLPRPRPGQTYQARIAPSHLNVFLNLANLIARNKSRLEEADALYRQAISMRSDYTQAYINRGDVLIKLNRTKEAQEVYEKALQLDNSNPDIYYNVRH